MPQTHKNPWPHFRTPLLLYTLLASFLLWFLPSPIHFLFTTDKTSRLFQPTTEPALVRIHTENKNPTSIGDYFIERIDLQTGLMKRIQLDVGPKKIPQIGELFFFSRNGSFLVIMHPFEFGTITLWDGHTGKLCSQIASQTKFWKDISCAPDNSLIAIPAFDHHGTIDLYDPHTGQSLGQLKDERNSPKLARDLMITQDGKYLRCHFVGPNGEGPLALFDMTTKLPVNYLAEKFSQRLLNEVKPTNSGFWILEWNRSDESLTLSHLDGPTGQLTTLAPELSRRLHGFPHIFSDNAGHLYLLQDCIPDTNNWQHRARHTILTWLNKLGIDWETTDTIQLRQISPDGKRILREQTFAANYAEISPDGNYLILMSQMKNESKNIVYRYPLQWNWFHALTWPTIPALLLLLMQRRTHYHHSSLSPDERG